MAVRARSIPCITTALAYVDNRAYDNGVTSSEVDRADRAPGHLIRHRYESISEDEIWATVQLLPIPGDPDDRYAPPRLTAEWLGQYESPHTVAAYGRELAGWLDWCQQNDVDPLSARRADADAYTRSLRDSEHPPAKSTLARKLSAISSWYSYLVDNDVIEANRFSATRRPKVDKDQSATVGLTVKEVRAFHRTLRAERGPQASRNRAMLGLLAALGLRVSELALADIADVHDRTGHRAITVHGKGRQNRTLPLPPSVAHDLDQYLGERADAAGVPVDEMNGPLFVTATNERLTQPQVYATIRRVAQAAEIPSWRSLSPHSFRHTAATAALDDGASLRDVQDLLGHADPRTTRRYDRNRGALDRSPAYRLAALYSVSDDQPETDTNRSA